MTRILIALFSLTLVSISSFAAEKSQIKLGGLCQLEGERAYIPSGVNQDVLYCQNGEWKLLYTRIRGEDRD